MKKPYLILLPAFVLFSFLFTGCVKSEENVCDYQVKAYPSSVTGATTATVNQEIDLTVSFGVVNSCGNFGAFTESTVGNITTVDVSIKYTGCTCNQTPVMRTTVYKFKRAVAGTYTLKFYQTDTTFITYTITVN
jgi:hypothetical protein